MVQVVHTHLDSLLLRMELMVVEVNILLASQPLELLDKLEQKLNLLFHMMHQVLCIIIVLTTLEWLDRRP